MPAGAVGPSAGGQGFEGLGYTSLHDDGTSPYDGAHQPPAEMGPEALDHHTLPPPAKSGDRDLEIDVVERRLRVGAGFDFQAWTYGGTVPGPIIRAREGSRIRVRLRNRTGRPHNLHFHGSHSPAMDGWEPIPPGGEFTYELEAGPVGVHPYHCHVPPLARHISRGLYGMLIVDPPAGRPPAQEIALVLSGFSDGTTPNRVMAWNGVAGFYHRFPIKVPAGEPVRAYVVNMTEYEPVGSFHLHARTFEVFPAGMGDDPAFSSDTITLGQGERAMLEFTLPTAGRYMFHPHQHHLAERGAMGWLAAV
ncbi:MAG: multicopper oxidase domain-containing protein [Actinomycetota bacterium]